MTPCTEFRVRHAVVRHPWRPRTRPGVAHWDGCEIGGECRQRTPTSSGRSAAGGAAGACRSRRRTGRGGGAAGPAPTGCSGPAASSSPEPAASARWSRPAAPPTPCPGIRCRPATGSRTPLGPPRREDRDARTDACGRGGGLLGCPGRWRGGMASANITDRDFDRRCGRRVCRAVRSLRFRAGAPRAERQGATSKPHPDAVLAVSPTPGERAAELT